VVGFCQSSGTADPAQWWFVPDRRGTAGGSTLLLMEFVVFPSTPLGWRGGELSWGTQVLEARSGLGRKSSVHTAHVMPWGLPCQSKSNMDIFNKPTAEKIVTPVV